ncbi:hypothetical protein GE118_00945 [Mycoplasma sp. NEAQ87857]|uniref:YitT family protein n=1 Tax=Mycoplasma sp. NEAQ87857 TaxID=2683967 RepID=UPI001316571E|nr:YitT family protein [Mycoplasma sp. NEAQ87857]QGZ97369.1 hypothetical protein GE118_00945 [Mycoplasma sp. NEAQ87857]
MKNSDNTKEQECKKIKIKKVEISTKNILDKYKNLQHFKKNNATLDSFGYVNNLNFDNKLDNKNIEETSEIIKYKMGQYLSNNKKAKLTFTLFWKRYGLRLFLLFIAALIFNGGIQMFLSRADTIPSGITGIPTILQYIFPHIRPYFALIYLALNVPLFLIFGWKIKKSFLWLTIAFMIMQIGINFIFTTNSVQNFFTSKIQLVPIEPYDVREYLYKPPFQDTNAIIINSADKFQESYNSGMIGRISTDEWNRLVPTLQAEFHTNKSGYELLKFILDTPPSKQPIISTPEALQYWYHTGKTWPILVYGIIGATLVGSGIALSWKAGGSTGGTDIIAYYFSTKSKKSVGNILSIVAITSAITFLIIYAFVKPNYGHVIIGMREISTFIYILFSTIVVNLLYPKYKKIKLTIISSEPHKIIAYFKLINYWHSYRIVRFKSGYTGKYSYQIETVVLLLESNNLIHDFKLIDPNIWINMTKVNKIIGKFNTQFVEQ